MTLHRAHDGKVVALQDLPADSYPVKVTAFVGDDVVWERVIEPYVAVDIPPATEETKGKIRLRIVYGDGEETWTDPVSAGESEAYIKEQLGEE